MNPMNALNQEFARVVIAEWSEPSNEHMAVRPERHNRLFAAARWAIAWVTTQINRRSDVVDAPLVVEPTNR